MGVTVALWLVCGAMLVALAWAAAPESFPQGALSCVIAGLSGAFVGGELFVVLGGPTIHEPDVLTLLGAFSGGLLCLEFVTRLPEPGVPAADSRVGLAWLSLQMWSPVLFAAAIGVALGRSSGSPLLGAAVTVAIVLALVRWYQYHARVGERS